MRLLVALALATLVAACRTGGGDGVTPPSPPPVAPCTLPDLPAAPVEYVEPTDFVLPDCPTQGCIQRALEEHPVVGLERGAVYEITTPILMPDHRVLTAVGPDSLPLPIIDADIPAWAAISGGDSTTIYFLHVRGPRAGQTHYPVRMADDGHADWALKGVNMALKRGWKVIGSVIEGFPGTCLLAADAEDVEIRGSRFAFCGYSGLSIFEGHHHCGRRVTVASTVLEYNGQDGMDSCASEAVYEDLLARGNGWDEHPGDGNGLLVCWGDHLPGAPPAWITFRNVLLVDNREAGLQFCQQFEGVTVDGVWTEGNSRALEAPGAVVTRYTQCNAGA